MSEKYWLVVGLGNPGAEFTATRHNVGFRIIDQLALKQGALPFQLRFQGEFSQFVTDLGSVLLLKPLTYMNRSGLSVREAVQWYKLPLDKLLVIHDDMDLGVGVLRFRQGGSAAGHHGVESIIQALRSAAFVRLRIGIGRPFDRQEGAAYVLSCFAPNEELVIRRVIDVASDAVMGWHEFGLTAAMNRYNGVRIGAYLREDLETSDNYLR